MAPKTHTSISVICLIVTTVFAVAAIGYNYIWRDATESQIIKTTEQRVTILENERKEDIEKLTKIETGVGLILKAHKLVSDDKPLSKIQIETPNNNF